MPRPIPFRIYYFRVSVLQEGLSFSDVLRTCIGWKDDDERRVITHAGSKIRLNHVAFAGGVFRGDVHYLDYNRAPITGDGNGIVKPVTLSEEEGVIDAAAFYYEPNMNVLAVERRGQGATLTRFAAFFENSEAIAHGSVELVPVLETDAYRKYQTLERVTKMSYKVAGGIRGFEMQEGESVLGGIASAHELDAPELDVTLSVGSRYRTRELELGKVKRFVSWLRRNNEADVVHVTRLQITGSGPDQSQTFLDLIEEKIADSVKLQPNDQRVITYDARVAQLQSSFASRRPELEAMYGGPK